MKRDRLFNNINTTHGLTTSVLDACARLPSDVAVDQQAVSQFFQQPSTKNAFPKIEIPDPTPIGPGGVKAVSTLPVHSTLLTSSDLSQIKTFYKLFKPFLLSKHQPSPERTISPAPPEASKTTDGCVRAPERQYGHQQTAKWNKRFEELVEFQKQHGHCLVPMHNHPNAALSNWVKRQRNQYQRKSNGIHSTLSNERQKALEDLGFVWDVHSTGWDERYEELRQFYQEHGHVSVPKSYKKNPPLARWVKCQRRQYRLFRAERVSFITKERIRLLKELQFDFNPRN